MPLSRNRRDYVTCNNCARPHKLQRKDLPAHLNSLESKGERKRQSSEQPSSAPANHGTRIATEQERRLRNMRAAWNHGPAEHMPEDVRKVLGV